MADFRTHLIGGALAGVAIAMTAAGLQWISWGRVPLVVLAGTTGGIAPDIDSDTGRPQGILFGAGMVLVPSAIVWRIELFREQPGYGIIAWLLLAAMRFPVEWWFREYTVHRGMFHSIPAMLVFGFWCFLLNGRRIDDVSVQVAMGLAGGVGYFVHLVLDELWSVDFNGRKINKIKIKKSLGTALKPWGKNLYHNLFSWALALVLGALVWKGMYGVALEDLLPSFASR